MSLGISRYLASAALSAAVLALAPSAGAVDWSKVEAKKVMFLYPAQTPWERLMTRERHSGFRRYPMKTCVGCHGGIDEHALGESLAMAEKFKEPTPIMGKPGFLDAQVKMAHDAANFYIQIVFDPGMQPDAAMDKDFDTKVTVMIDDGNVEQANTAGCWVACHQDAESMNMGVTGRTKYLTESMASADAAKSDADLAQMRAEGKYFEYWQARLNPGAKAVQVDGTILDKRVDSKKPAITADAVRNPAGVWTVTFSRKLTGVAGHKDLAPGKTYNVAFAIHAGHTAKRFHYVSFERTLRLDAGALESGEAYFVAEKK